MPQTIFVNYYTCIKNPSVVSTESITNWFKLISNSAYSEKITKARNGQLDYSKTKASLPCITYNFLFDNYKKDTNIKSSTGLLYIDIDDDSFDITILDKTKILAYYKSFGGKGFAIIVRVEGLTIDNFKSTYYSISDDLGIISFIDKNAVRASQFNVLSYDKDIFINETPFVYKAITEKVSSTLINSEILINNKKVSSTLINKEDLKNIEKVSSTHIIKKEREEKGKEKCLELNDTFVKENKFRFNNINEHFINLKEDYIVFENKEKVCIPFIPNIIKEGSRNRTMFFILGQYALLNPNSEIGFLKSLAGSINLHCYPQLLENEINSIVSSVIKKRADGTLILNYNSERRILFNPSSKLKPKDKQKQSAVLMGKFKTDKTQKKIREIIDSWNFEDEGKITQEKIAKKLDKSLATIKRNWYLFKELVSKLNSSFNKDKIISDKLLVPTQEVALEVLEIDPESLINSPLTLILNQKEAVTEQIPLQKNTTITFDKFISNCKYRYGSYVDDKRFDDLQKEVEEIWGLKFMDDINDDIKEYINSRIDYPDEDGYYVQLQLV